MTLKSFFISLNCLHLLRNKRFFNFANDSFCPKFLSLKKFLMLHKLTCYFTIALLNIRQDIVCKNIVCIFCTVALLNIRQNVLCKVVREIAKQLMVCSNLNLSETGNKKGVIHINPWVIY